MKGFNNIDGLVPIYPIEMQAQHDSKIKRIMFPIKNGYSGTFHFVQSKTLDKLRI